MLGRWAPKDTRCLAQLGVGVGEAGQAVRGTTFYMLGVAVVFWSFWYIFE